MEKISTVIAKTTINSPNLELSSSPEKKKVSVNTKIITKSNDQYTQLKSLKIFKKLIIITCIVFSFGGLGFGLALRFGQNLDSYQSQKLPINDFSPE